MIGCASEYWHFIKFLLKMASSLKEGILLLWWDLPPQLEYCLQNDLDLLVQGHKDGARTRSCLLWGQRVGLVKSAEEKAPGEPDGFSVLQGAEKEAGGRLFLGACCDRRGHDLNEKRETQIILCWEWWVTVPEIVDGECSILGNIPGEVVQGSDQAAVVTDVTADWCGLD